MPIHITTDGWVLETDNTAYALGINARGQLVHRYWGARLPSIGDYPASPDFGEYASFNGAGQLNQEEYPTYGDGIKYIEPCLIATFADGVRDTWLKFQRAVLVKEENVLAVVLEDVHYPLRVYVQYRILPEFDLIERYVELQNNGDEPIRLHRALSAQFHLPLGGDYELLHFTGRWNDEWVMHREPLMAGIKVLDSKRGTSSHHHNPSFMVANHHTTETQGDVWFGALEWSGNWKLIAEVTDFASTRLSMGWNDWDFEYTLRPQTDVVTPSVFLGFANKGFESASHRLHDFMRTRVPHPDYTRKVLFNSWEVTYFDAEETSQKHYAETASELGVELFVMDDGWFKGRNSDRAGLGDWFPDPQKFPNGIKPLVDHVNQLGMEFGLWLEPEMVNPDSDLYRTHPDWVIHFPTRERTTGRNQLILNLALTEVQDYLIERIDTLLTENNIGFIKWDMNRNISEAGWHTIEHNPKEIWVRYVEGVYRVWGTLRLKHPDVIWQSCSGGGGRADLGILNYADQIWLSDNTEPTRRIPMQRHFSYIYPANTMEAWVTDMGGDAVPLAFRFHVSMCGLLGIGANINKWTDEQKSLAKASIAEYKTIRHIVQQGDVYRLDGALGDKYSAIQYVSKDQRESVVFVFREYLPNPTNPYFLRLRGLNPTSTYTIEGFGTRTGQGWMSAPLVINLANFESKLLTLQIEDTHV